MSVTQKIHLTEKQKFDFSAVPNLLLVLCKTGCLHKFWYYYKSILYVSFAKECFIRSIKCLSL